MSAINTVKKFFPQVTQVIDATRDAHIEVISKDCKESKIKKHDGCAMAVALKRKFKLDGVIVSRSVAYLIKGKQARRFKLPETVSREVVSFDRGAGFAPGKYKLDKVDVGNQLGPRKYTQEHKNRNVVSARHRHITTNVRSVLGGQKAEGE